ncbi:MAG TPA: uroporphyrinogen-III synthase [Steroidobacteraceae bacterium]|nr:uroporphyrinogen-III synthase [Steroidobacteraceae bacterium]
MPYTWIVTKSQPHADSLVIQLRRQGFRALAISCIEHQWRDWPELRRIGAAGDAVLFVTSRAAAARIDVPQGIIVAAIAPTTSATLEARGIRVRLSAPGGVRELAQAVNDSAVIPAGAEVFYPTSDAALRQPEHLAAVVTLSQRLRVHTQAVYSTVAPDNLAQELTTLRAPDSPAAPPLGFCFWSPSSVENFAGARGFDLAPGPVVLVGGSTIRCWRETAPPAWRRAYQHDADTPLEWSLRFLERDPAADFS